MHLRPAGEITAASLESEQVFYFVIQEQVRLLRERSRQLLDVLEESRRPNQGRPSLPVRTEARRPSRKLSESHRNLLGEIAAAADIQLYLEELAGKAVRFGEADRYRLVELVEDVAMLEVLAEASDRPTGEQVLLYLWTANLAGKPCVDSLASAYKQTGFVRQMGGPDTPDAGAWWRWSGRGWNCRQSSRQGPCWCAAWRRDG